ncbi:MAG: hypothetical protein RLY93_16250 [Sumerlaeia bacterium]
MAFWKRFLGEAKPASQSRTEAQGRTGNAADVFGEFLDGAESKEPIAAEPAAPGKKRRDTHAIPIRAGAKLEADPPPGPELRPHASVPKPPAKREERKPAPFRVRSGPLVPSGRMDDEVTTRQVVMPDRSQEETEQELPPKQNKKADDVFGDFGWDN